MNSDCKLMSPHDLFVTFFVHCTICFRPSRQAMIFDNACLTFDLQVDTNQVPQQQYSLLPTQYGYKQHTHTSSGSLVNTLGSDLRRTNCGTK